MFFTSRRIVFLGIVTFCSSTIVSHAIGEQTKAPMLHAALQGITKNYEIKSKAPLLHSLLQPIIKKDSKKEAATEIEQAENLLMIQSIVVTGNHLISTEMILGEMNIKPNDSFSKLKLDISLKNIKSMGYFKSVTSQTEEKNNQCRITIQIQENPTISTIDIKGNQIVDTLILRGLMKSKPHSLYNLPDIRSDIKAINAYYEEKGYSKAKVYRVINPKQSGDPLIIYVSEGIINAITITGNTKTRDYIILRELDIKPGDAINDEALRKNLRRVFNLNYFNNVYPSFIPTRQHDEYTLELNLEEKETSGSFTFGGGYSPTGGFSVFSDLFWDNLFGTGQSILLKFNRGVGRVDGQSNNRTTYQFRYFNPWMWDKRKSFTFRTWRTSGNTSSFNPIDNGFALRDELRRGFDLAIGIPKTYDLRFSHKVKFEKVTLNDIFRWYDIYSYTAGVSHDTRDVRFNPRMGHYHTAYVEHAFEFRKDAISFTQLDVAFRQFFPILKKQVIALRAAYGYIRSPQLDDRDLFRSQIYTMGGSSTIRGYDNFNPVSDGNIRALYSAEYRFLFTPVFQVVLFVDAGYATYNKSEIWGYRNYAVGKGVGLRFNVPPIGPIRLDFGWDNQGEMRMDFNIGHAF